MANTMTLIQSVTVGAGGAASIDFTSIPSTYTDLVVKLSTRDSGSGDLRIRFNGVTTSSYTFRRLYGNGSSFGSDTASQTSIYVGTISDLTSNTASTFGNAEIYVPNYASTTAYKSISVDGVQETNASTAFQTLIAGLFSSNSAITSMSIYTDSGSYVQYSTAYLYGVKNA